MQINRYRCCPTLAKRDLIAAGCRPGGTWVNSDSVLWLSMKLVGDISLNIGFPDDLTRWDDFEFVLVLDESFCQPYTPFYEFLDHGIDGEPFPYLREVIDQYNRVMNSSGLFEILKK